MFIHLDIIEKKLKLPEPMSSDVNKALGTKTLFDVYKSTKRTCYCVLFNAFNFYGWVLLF